jgi:hypothetical protein
MAHYTLCHQQSISGISPAWFNIDHRLTNNFPN